MGYEHKTKAQLIRELEALRAVRSEARETGTSGSPEASAMARLVEELRLHQVELEMQNRELQEAQQQLEASRDRYADLYDFAPVGYATLDAKGRLRDINLTGASLLGVARSRLLGKPLASFVAKADIASFLGRMRGCLEAGEIIAAEVRLAAKSGEMWVHLHCVPIHATGDAAEGCRIAITDITERKQAEAERARLLERAEMAQAEAEAANREKDEFLAIVSHELRTPLNAILGWAQLLLAGGLDAAGGARALDAVARNAHLQATLIDDLLDVARIISGKVSLDCRPTDLAAVVKVAFDTVEPVARSKNVELAPTLELDPILVSADPVRLQQVVGNILSNAIKFTPAGGRVEVEVSRDEGSATLLVRDTGEGIEARFLPHIFDRFRQADMTTRRRHGGIGLGLAIVRHLVELHEGTVRAASDGRDRGATFVVSLPLVENGEGAASSRSASGASPGGTALEDTPTLEGLHVLVVEDVEDAQEVFALMLETSGARVTAVGTARAALEAIERNPPDVLVSDIGLPDEDGYDLIRAVRTLGPDEGGWIPAVALTAYASESDRTLALAAGFQAYVKKPAATADLVGVVARVAGRSVAGPGTANATKADTER